MFTGLIETVGLVSRIEAVNEGAQIEVYAPEFGRDLALGDSICVNGALLKIAAFERGAFVADISLETLDKTTLSQLRPQHRVNLERGLRLSDRVNGHVVTGHVDGIGRLLQRHISGNATIYQFELPEHLMPYIIEGAEIAIQGVSLHVARIKDNMIACTVVPVIEKMTNLLELSVDDEVNVEIDVLAKYIRKFSGRYEDASEDFNDYDLEKGGYGLSAKFRDLFD